MKYRVPVSVASSAAFVSGEGSGSTLIEPSALTIRPMTEPEVESTSLKRWILIPEASGASSAAIVSVVVPTPVAMTMLSGTGYTFLRLRSSAIVGIQRSSVSTGTTFARIRKPAAIVATTTAHPMTARKAVGTSESEARRTPTAWTSAMSDAMRTAGSGDFGGTGGVMSVMLGLLGMSRIMVWLLVGVGMNPP
jgi:hypothetical protein